MTYGRSMQYESNIIDGSRPLLSLVLATASRKASWESLLGSEGQPNRPVRIVSEFSWEKDARRCIAG